VLFGGSGNTQPLLVTSNTNQLSNVIQGVTVDLVGVSSSPVTLSVTRDGTNVSTDLTNFVSGFNNLTTQIGSLSTFNTTTNTAGLLLGDSTTQQIESSLYDAINTAVPTAGEYKTLASIGITIGNNAQLSFNQNTFNTAFANDPNAVMNLFSQATSGLGNVINNAITTLTDPVTGIVTIENNTLSTEIQNDQNTATMLNTLLGQQKAQLQAEFNNMESTLASLQGQQEALETLGTISSSVGSGAATQIGSGATNDVNNATAATSNDTSSSTDSTGGSIPSEDSTTGSSTSGS
jgi:flagellar hook-associated protein 2